MINIAEIRRQL